MGFLERVFGKVPEERNAPGNLNNPAVSLASPAIWSWLTGSEPTAAGEQINHATAMQCTTVYSCVRVLAESIASLPLKLYEHTSSGRIEAVDNPLYNLLTVAPNPEMTAVTFWETMVGCLMLTGNCYAQVVWNKAGQVDAIYPLHPLKTEPFRQPDGTLCFRTTDGQENGKAKTISSADALHVPLFCYDGLRGLSPVMQARQSIGLARAAEKYGARFFGNGSRPGGVMSTSSQLDERALQNVRESWERAQSGTNQGKTAFLPGDWKYEQIGLSPEESQFLATREFQRTEICALFRVPPHMVGDTSRLSNSNHEQQSLSFVTDTLRPIIAKLEVECVRKLLPTQGRKANKYVVMFDVSERLRGDFATTQKGYQTGVLSGWLSRNDVRRDLGMNPGPADLDVFMTPVNMQNAELLTTTESIQDQPIAADPIETPTASGRNALKQYRDAYLRLFRDAVGRIANRAADKRDLQAVSLVFQPLLESIADLSGTEARSITTSEWSFDASKTVAIHLKSLAERSTKWTDIEADAIAGQELTRAVRALAFAAHRAAGEAVAAERLEDQDEEK